MSVATDECVVGDWVSGRLREMSKRCRAGFRSWVVCRRSSFVVVVVVGLDVVVVVVVAM
jgi:hypothetical protein